MKTQQDTTALAVTSETKNPVPGETLSISLNPDLAAVVGVMAGGERLLSAAQAIAPALGHMLRSGREHVMFKLRVGYELAGLRLERGALQKFKELATKGLLGQRVSKWHLDSSLAMFDRYLASRGINKQGLPTLMEKAGNLAQTELWTVDASNANELICDMIAWADSEGLKVADDHLAQADGDKGRTLHTLPPGGDGKGGSDGLTPEQRAHARAVGGLEAIRALMLDTEAWHSLPSAECTHDCKDVKLCNHTLNGMGHLLRELTGLVDDLQVARKRGK